MFSFLVVALHGSIPVQYDAPEVNVDWGSLLNGIEPILSEKDMIGPTLDTSDNQFIYNENC